MNNLRPNPFHFLPSYSNKVGAREKKGLHNLALRFQGTFHSNLYALHVYSDLFKNELTYLVTVLWFDPLLGNFFNNNFELKFSVHSLF